MLKTFSLLDDEIKYLSFSSDGRFLASAGSGNDIDIYNTEKGWLSKRINAKGIINGVKWNPKY